MRRAIYPGSFDPATLGHLDIITRAAKLFDEVLVVVMTNVKKKNNYAFTVEERVDFLERCTKNLENVKVDSYNGLLAEYAKKVDAVAVVKGLRAVSDFEDEFQQSLTNKKLNPDLETVFLTADADSMFLSSSVVKQVCSLGGDVYDFVPEEISEDIIKKLRNT
ncbi:MAG: pantetheine-phosphate adenylyltransferase [Ruminococcaceae bacterium]|nr:pantetheine-phosphate adenylyltransferase [Oscillospiraceae bacterium]